MIGVFVFFNIKIGFSLFRFLIHIDFLFFGHPEKNFQKKLASKKFPSESDAIGSWTILDRSQSDRSQIQAGWLAGCLANWLARLASWLAADPESKIRDPRSNIRDPTSKFHHRRSNIHPTSKIQHRQ